MAKKIPKNFILQPELVTLLCNHFKTKNISEAVNKGLIGFLSNPSCSERMDDFALHQLLSIEERITTNSYTIRIPEKLMDIIRESESEDEATTKITFKRKNTMFNLVTIMLANYLYCSTHVHTLTAYGNDGNNYSAHVHTSAMPPLPFEKIKVDTSMKLLTLLGSKWNPQMQSAIERIYRTSGKTWLTSIEPFAGALGIFANFRFATHEIINDLDLKKVNLYRTIQNDRDMFLLSMLSESVDKKTFENKRKIFEAGVSLNNSKYNLEAAVLFLYLNLLSVRGSGTSFKGTLNSYKKKLGAIAPLNERLKDTEICGINALEVISRHMKDKDAIFIVDPPYLDTDVYSKNIDNAAKEFGYAEHMELAKLLRDTHSRHGNDFIYFCRTTTTRSHNQKTKEVTNSAELNTGDRHMQGRIDDLYWGYGYYYVDIPYNKDGTIERVITSFNFKGAQPYGQGRGQK